MFTTFYHNFLNPGVRGEKWGRKRRKEGGRKRHPVHKTDRSVLFYLSLSPLLVPNKEGCEQVAREHSVRGKRVSAITIMVSNCPFWFGFGLPSEKSSGQNSRKQEIELLFYRPKWPGTNSPYFENLLEQEGVREGGTVINKTRCTFACLVIAQSTRLVTQR
jgi:hypothetical protein